MRAHASALRSRIVWTYQVSLAILVASMAVGGVGAWRAISTGEFWPSVQVMGLAWAAILATALVLLFGDGGGGATLICTPSPSPLPSRANNGNGADNGFGGGDGGNAPSSTFGTSSIYGPNGHRRRSKAAEGGH